ncbi:hypothetical protein ACIQOV_01065 [Kitasatospora sp. NPDC091257]|uniref:hypothetical protein n=1 Tax=Kitasatospora sp. NPDC091257 TaxID=3364084 RepID=UPI00381FE7F0
MRITHWLVPAEHRESEECRAAGRRMVLAEETVGGIEESGVDPALPLTERLAAAFDSVVRIDPAREPAMSFEAHAA